MNKLAIRLLTLAMLSLTLAAAPVVSVVYAAPDNDPPPPPQKKRNPAKPARASNKPHSPMAIAPPTPRSTTATTTPSAIAQLKALGRDDWAAVANLIGYSYRKLGDYKVSQIWYERALKADPSHVKTWQYYGLWQVEQGNRDQAQYHLNRIAQLTGTQAKNIARSPPRWRSRRAPGWFTETLPLSVIASEAKQSTSEGSMALLRRIAPRNDKKTGAVQKTAPVFYCSGFTSSPPRPPSGTPDARPRANRTCGRRDRRRASPGPIAHRPATGRATPWNAK